MRIQKPAMDSRTEAAKPVAESEKNGRFSKILEEKRGESQLDNHFPTPNPEWNQLQSTSAKPQQVAGGGDAARVDQLASEIVSSVAAHEKDGVHSVEIQFNSNVLDGLRVQVQSERGVVSINFIAATPQVSRFLNSNLATLRGALENRGVQITQLAVNRRNG